MRTCEFETSLVYIVSSRLHSETLPKKKVTYLDVYLCIYVETELKPCLDKDWLGIVPIPTLHSNLKQVTLP